jgi:transcriptional regulator, padR-like family
MKLNERWQGNSHRQKGRGKEDIMDTKERENAMPEYKAEIDELARRRQWKRLLTATFVLDILTEESNYGNRIEREIYERTNNVYRPNPNELYPVLRYMESRHFVESRWDSPDKRSKRIYSITDKGRAAVPYMKEQVLDWLVTLRIFTNTIQEQFGNPDKE